MCMRMLCISWCVWWVYTPLHLILVLYALCVLVSVCMEQCYIIFVHVTPLLIKLHWLPLNFRIDYKLATVAFRCFDHTLPPYISSAVTDYQGSLTLRSNNSFQLKRFGKSSFEHQVPVVWNSLPTNIRNAASLSTFKTENLPLPKSLPINRVALF